MPNSSSDMIATMRGVLVENKLVRVMERRRQACEQDEPSRRFGSPGVEVGAEIKKQNGEEG